MSHLAGCLTLRLINNDFGADQLTIDCLAFLSVSVPVDSFPFIAVP